MAKFEIEVDDDLPCLKTHVPIGVRLVKPGDCTLSGSGRTTIAEGGGYYEFVLRPKWQPPECLRGKGLVLHSDSGGAVFIKERGVWASEIVDADGNIDGLAAFLGFTTEGMPPIPPEGLELT